MKTHCLGLLMLDTQFTRWPGDLGLAESWPLPVRRLVVPGAVPAQVVVSAQALTRSGWQSAFEGAVRQLVGEGVTAITTSCGFLVLLQRALQAAAGQVPVVSSALCLLPDLLAREPEVGVLTIHGGRLGPEHFLAAGVEAGQLHRIHVGGMDPEGAFAAPILRNRAGALDRDAAERDVVQAALRLKARAPLLRSVVLECTNLASFTDAIRAATAWELLSVLNAPALTLGRVGGQG